MEQEKVLVQTPEMRDGMCFILLKFILEATLESTAEMLPEDHDLKSLFTTTAKQPVSGDQAEFINMCYDLSGSGLLPEHLHQSLDVLRKQIDRFVGIRKGMNDGQTA